MNKLNTLHSNVHETPDAERHDLYQRCGSCQERLGLHIVTRSFGRRPTRFGPTSNEPFVVVLSSPRRPRCCRVCARSFLASSIGILRVYRRSATHLNARARQRFWRCSSVTSQSLHTICCAKNKVSTAPFVQKTDHKPVFNSISHALSLNFTQCNARRVLIYQHSSTYSHGFVVSRAHKRCTSVTFHIVPSGWSCQCICVFTTQHRRSLRIYLCARADE